MKELFPCAFTVDVEDGITIAMRDVFNKNVPQTDRVLRCTHTVLDLLDQHKVKGTFFTLGMVAKDFPELILRIVNEGHELAVHGFNHWQFHKMSLPKASEELSTAKKLLEDISGVEVKGHRAPAFSIHPATSWAFDILAECGFTYDSSIMPVSGFHYGWPGFSTDIKLVRTKQGNEIIEVPLPVMKILGKSVPFSGGSYLRLFPISLVENGFNKQIENGPAVLYMHPYEVDDIRYPDYYFEALKNVSLLKQLKIRSYWLGRKAMLSKLDRLLGKFHFATISEILEIRKQKHPLSITQL